MAYNSIKLLDDGTIELTIRNFAYGIDAHSEGTTHIFVADNESVNNKDAWEQLKKFRNEVIDCGFGLEDNSIHTNSELDEDDLEHDGAYFVVPGSIKVIKYEYENEEADDSYTVQFKFSHEEIELGKESLSDIFDITTYLDSIAYQFVIVSKEAYDKFIDYDD